MMPQRNKRPSSEPETQQHDLNMPSSSSSLSSSPFLYPPGFRFVPTDEEIFLYHLKPFISLPNLPIHHVNIYESNPQQLSAEYEKGNLTEWFFISERTKMKKDGKKQKRGDNGGYWNATVAAKKINAGQGVVGYKRCLAYYVGKQPNGLKTDWLMQEYWFDSSGDNKTVDHALCKIYLSPMANKKKKEEELVHLPNVENYEPQQQLCPTQTPLVSHQPLSIDISDYQQPQSWPVELDSYQSQHHDIDYHELHQPETFFDAVQYHIQQFWPALLNSHQSHCHDIQYDQQQPLEYIEYQQSFSAPLDSDHPHQSVSSSFNGFSSTAASSSKHDPNNMPSSSSPAYYPFVYPPSLRFVPTDEELILYYLKPFLRDNNTSWPNLHIYHVNIYQSNPQQLSAEYEKGNLKEWFFISERTKMKKDGKRQKRGDNGGYWHATVAATKINDGQDIVGYKTSLAYYVGTQPNGTKTNWLMQEYWFESVDYALCKIYLTPRGSKRRTEEEEKRTKKEEGFRYRQRVQQ